MIKNKINKYKIYSIFIFLIWPIISLFIAFKTYRIQWAKNILWFFIAFYGYTMVVSNTEMDAFRLVSYFQEYVNMDYSFSDVVKNSSSQTDVVREFINYFFTQFTSSTRVYLMLLGLIFGYFYSRIIWLLLDKTEGKIRRNSLLLFVLVLVMIPFWFIGGFRFWTAAIIFLYGVINYFLRNNIKYLLWSISTFLLHFAFIYPIAILILYLFIGNKIRIYYWFYIFSLFFLEISSFYINSNIISFQLANQIEEKILGYSSDVYVEKINMLKSVKLNWYAELNPILIKYLAVILVTLIYFRFRSILKELRLESIFCFSILLLSMCNLISDVPSGNRFLLVSYFTLFSVLFLIFQRRNIYLHNIIQLYFYITIGIFTIVSLRIGLDTIGLSTLISNPIFSLFGVIDIALIEIFK